MHSTGHSASSAKSKDRANCVRNIKDSMQLDIRITQIAVLLLCSVLMLSLASCGPAVSTNDRYGESARYLSIIDDEPETMDPQCTSEYYTVPFNVFDRLVDVRSTGGEPDIVPSLAEKWRVSDDGLVYTFKLREGVRFSNGEELTSEDVGYTFARLLSYENSCNQDLVMYIDGADELRNGEAGTLKGFKAIDELTFTIELEHPYAAFLACLATPGASILDQETTEKFGSAFGSGVKNTIGTGPFIVESWEAGEQILLRANADSWYGAPGCRGIKMLFDSGEVSHVDKFNDGEIDILDLDFLDSDAEYFARGDIYLKNIERSTRVGISYIAFNESVKPLDDARVRCALQLALDRKLLLKAVTGGRGRIENGIFPYGLTGYNPKLEEIPYDPAEAKRLLEEAGCGDGFELEIDCTDTTTGSQMDLLELAAYMWGEIGVDAHIRKIESDEFYELRGEGKLSCYTGSWSADFDDPSNFIYTFFGNVQNTNGRSLCYDDKDIMKRVEMAAQIVDDDERIKEYQELEKIIVQDDAAWVPLYSRQHLFIISDRVEGFTVLWNGWSSNNYRDVKIK